MQSLGTDKTFIWLKNSLILVSTQNIIEKSEHYHQIWALTDIKRSQAVTKLNTFPNIFSTFRLFSK